MTKNHKSSKRKDLAFITFETNEEAKNCSETFNKINLPIPIGDNICVSMAFSQQAMQTKKKIKEKRKVNIPPPHVGVTTNQKFPTPYTPQIQNIHNNHMDNSKKTHVLPPQQKLYQNNMMFPQNNMNSISGLNSLNNIPNFNNIPNANILQNLGGNINPLNHMQNKPMIPQQTFPQNNMGNQMNALTQASAANLHSIPGMTGMNHIPQLSGLNNNLNQVNPVPNMNNLFQQNQAPNQFNPNINPNLNFNPNLNQNQLMYLMNYNNSAFKVKF